MDQVPLGMILCQDRKVAHAPVRLPETGMTVCFYCGLTVTEWNVYIPEEGKTVPLWLSETVVCEEDELF